jgi:hypothetical protein
LRYFNYSITQSLNPKSQMAGWIPRYRFSGAKALKEWERFWGMSELVPFRKERRTQVPVIPSAAKNPGG